MLAFGVLCLFGAFAAPSGEKWPVFMPPQLDAVAFLVGLISAKVGAIVAGAVALLLGAVAVVAAVLPPRKQNGV
jgi:hypothetical protein